jgi:hypothetical protein
MQKLDSFGQVESDTELGTIVSGWTNGSEVPTLVALNAMLNASLDRSSYVMYDSLGQVVREMDALGHVSSTSYDVFGAVVVTTQHFHAGVRGVGGGISVELSEQDRRFAQLDDKSNHRTWTISADGQVTMQQHDAFGGVISVTTLSSIVPGWITGATVPSIAVLESLLSSIDRTSFQLLDSLGRVVVSISSAGEVTKQTYSPYGDVVSVTQCYELAEKDLDGAWVVPEVSAHDRTTVYSYDSLGRQTYSIDSVGRAERVEYNSFGEVKSRIAYSKLATKGTGGAWVPPAATPGADRVYSYAYNLLGLQLYQVDDKGVVEELRYNAFNEVSGRVTYAKLYTAGAERSAASIRAYYAVYANRSEADRGTSYLYNANGQVEYEIDNESAVLRTRYNNFGEVIETTQYLNLASSSWSADSAGNMSSITVNSIRTTLKPTVGSLVTQFVRDALGNTVASIKSAIT